jgi:hypothetical protein
MFELSPLTTTSGRPLDYGNAHLTHDSTPDEHGTLGRRAAGGASGALIAERWLLIDELDAEAA